MKTFYLLIVFILIACGQKSATNNSSNTSPINQETLIIEDTYDGQYLAELLPLNSHLTNTITGAVTVSIEEDDFIGDVRFFGNSLTAETAFEQTIHVGNRCPTLADDENLDGIIDEKEAMKVVGDILIPLDADLNSQWLGANIHPLADSFGSYYYSQKASFQKLLEDLWEVDINLEDQLVKIEKDTRPEFEGRIALIRGISKSLFLPNSVENTNKRGKHAGFPLLCGVFQKVKTPPGRRNIDRYPYPNIEGENPNDMPPVEGPQDPTKPDYDIEPTGPILDYGS